MLNVVTLHTFLNNFVEFRTYEVHPHTPDTNLRYGLRSGGGSFGIVTEFLIKSYPHAETLSFVAFVFIKDSDDLRQLIKAGQDGKYAINILQPLYFRRPKPSLLVSTFDSQFIVLFIE